MPLSVHDEDEVENPGSTMLGRQVRHGHATQRVLSQKGAQFPKLGGKFAVGAYGRRHASKRLANGVIIQGQRRERSVQCRKGGSCIWKKACEVAATSRGLKQTQCQRKEAQYILHLLYIKNISPDSFTSALTFFNAWGLRVAHFGQGFGPRAHQWNMYNRIGVYCGARSSRAGRAGQKISTQKLGGPTHTSHLRSPNTCT